MNKQNENEMVFTSTKELIEFLNNIEDGTVIKVSVENWNQPDETVNSAAEETDDKGNHNG